MKIKICGLFRNEDIDYVNEAGTDYAGFVFAESRRQVSPEQAARLRKRLNPGIVPVGVFVNAPIAEIAALYRSGIIGIAQLHGTEDEEYIKRLKDICGSNLSVIKTIFFYKQGLLTPNSLSPAPCPLSPDFLLFDSGAGSGGTFNWDMLKPLNFPKPWFLAGGINLGNIEQAMALNPFALDVSSGAETDGIKDRTKILQLIASVRKETNNE